MKDDNDLTEVQKLRQAMAKNTNKDYMKRLNEDNSDIEMPESLTNSSYPFVRSDGTTSIDITADKTKGRKP